MKVHRIDLFVFLRSRCDVRCIVLFTYLSTFHITYHIIQLDTSGTDATFCNILGTTIITFMEKSKSVFPNSLLSKQDFKTDCWKRCMVFVFEARYVYGKDGQKQWRNFDMQDLKFNMRMFEMWKRMETVVRACFMITSALTYHI